MKNVRMVLLSWSLTSADHLTECRCCLYRRQLKLVFLVWF